MKVILNADLDHLGRRGDVVEVRRGYARNYLMPRNLALPATKGTMREAEHTRGVREERDRREVTEAQELAAKISASPLKLAARAGDEGQLFGSITSSEIADQLQKAQDIQVDRRKIHLEDPIRSLGVHEFEVRLHAEVSAKGSIEVVAES